MTSFPRLVLSPVDSWKGILSLPMCCAQVSQYSAYKDSKQLQQYGLPSFMMYLWPPSTVSHSKQQKCFMCQCLPSASVHSSAKMIWKKPGEEMNQTGSQKQRGFRTWSFVTLVSCSPPSPLSVSNILWYTVQHVQGGPSGSREHHLCYVCTAPSTMKP